MLFEGSCHCKTIAIALETSRAPSDLPVRRCGCTFCTRHRPCYTSDPSGHLTIRAASEDAFARYRFGLRLADFVICRSCGVFVAAFDPGPPGRAVANLAVFDRASEFVATPTEFTAYDSEDAATRSARRARGWTPATLVIGS